MKTFIYSLAILGLLSFVGCSDDVNSTQSSVKITKDMKCGAGKCGSGKCGKDMKKTMKCGAGKCGSGK